MRPEKIYSAVVWIAMWALGAGQVQAAVNQWSSIGPEGADVVRLSIDPHNPATVYAGTWYGYQFKTADGGASWMLDDTAPTPGAMIFDPQVPGTIYARNASGVSKSTDGGMSWNSVNAGLPSSDGVHFDVSALVIDPQNSLTLYAGTAVNVAASSVVGYGIWKSTDGGASWSAASSGLPKDPKSDDQYAGVFDLAIDSQNPGTIYAVIEHFGVAGSWILKSTDGGGSWSPASSGLPRSRMIMAIDPQNPATLYVASDSGVFRTDDGGQTWLRTKSAPAEFIITLLVDPQSQNTLYAVAKIDDPSVFEKDAVYKSVDRGDTWNKANSGLPATMIRPLAIDPQNSATLYAGTRWGVYKSSDGGANWGVGNSGLVGSWIGQVAAQPGVGGALFAIEDQGLIKSLDGGGSWELQRMGSWWGIVIDSRHPSTMYLENDDGIDRSTDGGITWSGIWNSDRDDFGGLAAFVIDPRDPNTLYAADSCTPANTLSKSMDGGATWVKHAFKDLGVSATTCVVDLVIDPVNPNILYAAFYSGDVFKSTDAGATWANVLPPAVGYGTLAVDPEHSGTLYVVSYPKGLTLEVQKSTDGGTTWNPANAGLPDRMSVQPYGSSMAVDPLNPNRLYLAVNSNFSGEVFVSVDGGASWADSGLPVSAGSSLSLGPGIQTTLYAATAGRGVFAITFLP
jgi:photosystem II stability/assembly factor-like uncharacterized protein